MARKSPDTITDLFTLTEQKDASIQAQKRKTKAAVFYLDPDVPTFHLKPSASPLPHLNFASLKAPSPPFGTRALVLYRAAALAEAMPIR